MSVSSAPLTPQRSLPALSRRLGKPVLSLLFPSLLSACGTSPKPQGTEPDAPLAESPSEEPTQEGAGLQNGRAPTETSSEAAAAFRRESPPNGATGEASLSSETQTAQPRPLLPSGLVLGRSIEVPVSGDRPLRVAHADGTSDGALVYLHGMCGNPKGAEPWIDQALAHGTVIVLRADVPCPDRPGYKWPKEIDKIQARLDQALKLVKAQRAGLLDTEHVTLIGYSQGAHRAEQLARTTPARYPRVMLGGPPTAPEPDSFRQGVSIAVLGGELEDASHMMSGASALSSAGLRARFFLLPHAHHGGYGPEGPKVMAGVLSWLFAVNE